MTAEPSPALVELSHLLRDLEWPPPPWVPPPVADLSDLYRPESPDPVAWVFEEDGDHPALELVQWRAGRPYLPGTDTVAVQWQVRRRVADGVRLVAWFTASPWATPLALLAMGREIIATAVTLEAG